MDICEHGSQKRKCEICSLQSDIDEMLASFECLLIYACRYAHNRKTGAANQIVNIALHHWDLLGEDIRKKIKKESNEAGCNLDDWHRLKDR